MCSYACWTCLNQKTGHPQDQGPIPMSTFCIAWRPSHCRSLCPCCFSNVFKISKRSYRAAMVLDWEPRFSTQFEQHSIALVPALREHENGSRKSKISRTGSSAILAVQAQPHLLRIYDCCFKQLGSGWNARFLVVMFRRYTFSASDPRRASFTIPAWMVLRVKQRRTASVSWSPLQPSTSAHGTSL